MRTNRTQTCKEAGGRLGKASGVQSVGSAFSRLDMLAGITAIVVLAALLALNFTGERGRIASCKHNLKILGGAMQEYASSHAGALPPASIAQLGVAWDAQILPHLPSKVVANGIDHAFQCPSDNVSRFRPRSYAMSAHNMSLENWPPGPDNETGVGLVWDANSVDRLLGEQAAVSATDNKDSLALVKLAGIPSPADTVYLTEAINGNNNLKDTQSAAVSGSGQQMEGLEAAVAQKQFHFGRFNYLMADGHVERLSPFASETISGSGGVWSVKKMR